MRKFLFALMLSISTSAFALPGLQEFVMVYPDEELRFINDGAYLVILSTKKNANDNNSNQEPQSCIMTPMNKNEAVFGSNKVVFYDDYAVVNDKKRRFYVAKKTDLLFYRDLCHKP
jgi:hypothetical protein